MRLLILKGGGPITGAKSTVGLTSSPMLDTGGVEFRLISGKSILEAWEEGRREKEGLYQEDTIIKGVHFRNGLFPDTGEPPASSSCAHF